MNTEQILSMKGGSQEYSYANNSKLQEKTILETKPLFEEAIKEICNTMHPKIFVAADLGCSSGPNALLVLNTITNSIEKHYSRSDHNKLEIQFFLNDLPSNDFNNIFQLSALYEKQVKQEKKNEFLPFYVVGMPGSFYGRLFPTKTVHFFHSSYSLMWLSQVPKGLKGDDFCQLNKGNIYLNDESSPKLFQLYLDQYKRDFSTFLESRSKELIMGGSMILSFLGRKIVPSTGSLFHFFGLLSDALNAMVSEEKVILEGQPLIEEAVKEICNTMLPEIFVAADLGALLVPTHCSLSLPSVVLLINIIVHRIERSLRFSSFLTTSLATTSTVFLS